MSTPGSHIIMGGASFWVGFMAVEAARMMYWHAEWARVRAREHRR